MAIYCAPPTHSLYYQRDLNIREIAVKQAEAELEQLRKGVDPLLALEVQRAQLELDRQEEEENLEPRETVQIVEILQIVWKRLWLIMLGTLLISVVVFVASRNMTPIYRAKVTMRVNQSADAPFSYRSILTGGNLALTYSKLLKTRPILETVIANLSLDLSSDDLRDKLVIDLIPETQLLELSVEDTDAQHASDVANEIAFTFISSHNTEQQIQNLAALEQDVVAQLENLKELIEHNRSAMDTSRTSSGSLAEEESNSLQSTLSSQQSAYANLLATYLDIQLTEAQFFDVLVIEPAVPPAKPTRPKIVLFTFLGAFVGLNLGVGLAFLLEHLQSSFETRDDVSQILSLPTLGAIPRLRSKERSSRLFTSTTPRSSVSEAFRALRTNLRFASVDEPLTTLLITGVEPGIGKTTVAANLAVVCAQSGLNVVLIDADLRHPTLHELFDLNSPAGLTDLLVDNVQDVEQCMVRTEIDNLRLIASGPIPPNPSELLGSKRMKAILDKVREIADLVILDTPPTLAVTDAAVLAQGVDGVLLVVYAGKTRREAARHAVESLLQVGADVMGVVLNAVPKRRGDYYGYEYYRDGGEKRKRRLPVWERSLAAVQWALKRK